MIHLGIYKTDCGSLPLFLYIFLSFFYLSVSLSLSLRLSVYFFVYISIIYIKIHLSANLEYERKDVVNIFAMNSQNSLMTLQPQFHWWITFFDDSPIIPHNNPEQHPQSLNTSYHAVGKAISFLQISLNINPWCSMPRRPSTIRCCLGFLGFSSCRSDRLKRPERQCWPWDFCADNRPLGEHTKRFRQPMLYFP